jgi:hypothetical protein
MSFFARDERRSPGEVKAFVASSSFVIPSEAVAGSEPRATAQSNDPCLVC